MWMTHPFIKIRDPTHQEGYHNEEEEEATSRPRATTGSYPQPLQASPETCQGPAKRPSLHDTGSKDVSGHEEHQTSTYKTAGLTPSFIHQTRRKAHLPQGKWEIKENVFFGWKDQVFPLPTSDFQGETKYNISSTKNACQVPMVESPLLRKAKMFSTFGTALHQQRGYTMFRRKKIISYLDMYTNFRLVSN